MTEDKTKKFASIFDEDYEESSSSGDYLPMPKEGSYIRVLLMGQGLVGWCYWNNQDRPVKTVDELDHIPDPQKEDTKQKRFSVFPVWDIESQSFKLLEVTQKGVRQWIIDTQRQGEHDLLAGEVGIRITPEGSGINTKYKCATTSIKPVQGTYQQKAAAIEKEAERIKELWTECPLASEEWMNSVFTKVESSPLTKEQLQDMM